LQESLKDLWGLKTKKLQNQKQNNFVLLT